MAHTKIKNLIFDLGGVIIDIDPPASLQALKALVTAKNIELPTSLEHDIFLQYETGEIDDVGFRNALLEAYKYEKHITPEHTDEAWNKMLLGIPQERIDLLKALRKNYSMYLLSNTNAIHLLKVNEILRQQTGVNDLGELFDKVYYSHQMGLRKPGTAIFKRVLDENNLIPEETLFIDDNADNIKGAAQLNIKTLHITSKQVLFEYFKNER